MQITIPDYFHEFSCIAGECPDTCCAGWQIMIDKKSLLKYKKVTGIFQNRLYNGIDWYHKCFRQYDGKCDFLNEEGLCDIYAEAGADMLCKTCKKYPRHYEEYEGLTEISLSISCPEVSRIILTKSSSVTFQTYEKNIPEKEYEEFDYLLFSTLMDARDEIIKIIQSREIPLKIRVCKSLAYIHDLQVCINRQQIFSFEEIKKRHENTGYGDRFEEKVMKHTCSSCSPKDVMMEMWRAFIPEMEILRKEWPVFLEESLHCLYEKDSLQYQKKIDDFRKKDSDWEIWQEQLLVYWIFTYFSGAVYDGDAFTKLKMAVVSTVFVRDLYIGRYYFNNEKISIEELQKIASWYSRELEHSDSNLNKAEKILKNNKSFSFDNLLNISILM